MQKCVVRENKERGRKEGGIEGKRKKDGLGRRRTGKEVENRFGKETKRGST